VQENDATRGALELTKSLALALGLGLLAWWTWAWVLELPILGWDSFPLIAAGRCDSWSQILPTFGEELMDGRYPLGHFWRPLLHLSLGLDHALHGLAPRGYHRTDLGLLLLTAWALVRLGARLSQGRGWLVGGLAGLVWVLHPIQLEVLSVPARRGEGLAVFFTCAALTSLLARRPLRGCRSAWIGLLCAAALASKETGILAMPLVLFAHWQTGPRDAAQSLRPALVVWVLALLARTWVLNGLGGSECSSLALGLPSSTPYPGELLFPSASLGLDPSPAAWLGLALPLAIVLALFLLRRSSPRAHPGLLLILWISLLASVSAMSGVHQAWYALPFLAPIGLGLALLAEAALRSLKKRSSPRPFLPLGALALVLFLLGRFASLSLLVDPRR